ncbi:MAG: hypothetical protein AABM29_01955 [Actinomycetota bacterium]
MLDAVALDEVPPDPARTVVVVVEAVGDLAELGVELHLDQLAEAVGAALVTSVAITGSCQSGKVS